MKRRRVILASAAAVLVIAAVGGIWIYNANTLVKGKKGHYTYRSADTAPESWSPLEWESPGEQRILSWTTSPLYVVLPGEEEFDLTVFPELAAALPEDVTAAYAGAEDYGVPEDAGEGYAWRITLREDACWEDKTAITAADFARTLQYYLDSDSPYASEFTMGIVSLANAAEYRTGGVTPAYGDDYAQVEDGALLFSLTEPNVFCKNRSLEEYYQYYCADQPALFWDGDGNNLYGQLEALSGEGGFVPLTEEIRALLETFCANCGEEDEQAYKKLCFYVDEESALAWDSVGFETDGDYAMTFILSSPVSAEELAYGLSGLYLINAGLYGDDAQSYGTDKDSYLSYGPYKITSYDEESGMVLKKNSEWFGYQDEELSGQYQTTDIRVTYGLTHEEEWELWTQGNLSALRLGAQDADSLSDSALVSAFGAGGAYVYLINSDLVSLQEESAEQENHTLLYYKDFRRAISLALDRAAYVQENTFASEAGFGLLGDGFAAAVGTGEAYRDTQAAQAALCSVYGVEEVSELSGYDVQKASSYLANAYEACLEDGNIRDTDKVTLSFYSENPEVDSETERLFLQAALDEAALGTALEGRILLTEAASADTADICGRVLSGELWDPYRLLRYFCEPESQLLEGYYEDTYKTSITLSGDKSSNTVRAWYELLCGQTYRSADPDTKTTILAALEKQILNTYSAVPVYCEYTYVLYAGRLSMGSEAGTLAVTDGVRFLSYGMDDAQWASYCKKQGYALTY